MTDLNRVKETIRDLLNLARNDAAADGEVRNAMAFASKLMGQHNLTEEDLPTVDEKIIDLEKAATGDATAYSTGRNVTGWEGQLALWVTKFVGGIRVYCKRDEQKRMSSGILALDDNGHPKLSAAFVFYGLDEDAQLGREIFEEMSVTIAAMGRLKWGGVFRGPGREYCEGFVVGLNDMLSEARQKELELAKSQDRMGIGNALVVIDKRALVVKQKSALAQRYIREKGLRLGGGRSRSSGQYHGDARADGRADGRKAKVGGERRKRLAN